MTRMIQGVRAPGIVGLVLMLGVAPLLSASSVDGLAILFASPPDGAWFPTSSVSIQGSADMPNLDSRELNATSGLQNGTFNGTVISANAVTVAPAGGTTVRYANDFNFTEGTRLANLDPAWSYGTSWSISSAFSSILPGAPALTAYGYTDAYWLGMTPAPITRATLSFRYASTNAALEVYYYVNGTWPGATRLFSSGTYASETNVSADLTQLAAGTQSLYLYFYVGAGGGDAGYAVIDDFEVDLSFNASGPSGVWANSTGFDGNPDAWDQDNGSQWNAFNVGPPMHGRSFTHKYDGYQSSNASSTIIHGNSSTDIVDGRVSFNYSCQASGRIAAFASAFPGAPETLLFASPWGVSLSFIDANMSTYVGTRTFDVRLWAQGPQTGGACSVDDFNLTFTLVANPPSFESGFYTSPSVDLGLQVNWTSIGFTVLGPPLSGARLEVRTSADGGNWTNWLRVADGSTIPLPDGRFFAIRARLWGYSDSGYANLTSVRVGYFAIVSVDASIDGGFTWVPIPFSTASGLGGVNWSGNVTLRPGTNNVTVRVGDTTGAFNLTNRTLFWDDFPPGLTGTPVDEGIFTNRSAIGWTWSTASDVGLGVAEYRVSVGTAPGAEDVVSNQSVGMATQFNLSGARDGTEYFLKVHARDAGGLWGGWSNSSDGIFVDLTPPGSCRPTPDRAWFNTSVVTWSWPPCLDAGSGVDVYQVRIGSLPSGADLQLAAELNATNFTFLNGTHAATYYLSIRGRDAAGNYGPWSLLSSPARVDLEAPPAPPAALGPSGFANVTTGTWSWTAVVDSGAGVDYYEFEAGSTPYGSDFLAGLQTPTTRVTLTGLLDAVDVYVRVRAIDVAGNIGNWSPPSFPLSVDRTAPSWPMTVEGPPSWTNNSTLNWKWGAASDGGSGVAGYLIRIGSSPGGSQVLSERVVAAPSFSLSSASQGGAYYLTARPFDAAGNVGAEAVSDGARVDLTAPSPPGNILEPASPSNGTNAVWSWGGSIDTGSGVAGYEVEVGSSQGAGDVHDWAFAPGTTFEVLAPITGQTYFISVRSVDVVGWRSTRSVSLMGVFVDALPPAVVNVSSHSATTSEHFREISWSPPYEPGGSGIAGYEIQISGMNGTVLTAVDRSTRSFLVSGTDGETVWMSVRAVDAAHNSGPLSAAVSTLFDFSPPTAPGTIVAVISGTTINWTWAASSDATSGVERYNVRVGRSPGEADLFDGSVSEPSFELRNLSPGDRLFISVAAVDRASNVNSTEGPTAGFVVPQASPAQSPSLLAPGVACAFVLAGLSLRRRRRQ